MWGVTLVIDMPCNLSPGCWSLLKVSVLSFSIHSLFSPIYLLSTGECPGKRQGRPFSYEHGKPPQLLQEWNCSFSLGPHEKEMGNRIDGSICKWFKNSTHRSDGLIPTFLYFD